MNELGDIKFSRATLPIDAVSLQMETIEAGDASTALICAAVYVRFERQSGEYSCELVVGKSKIVPSGMTVPKSELYAMEINSSLGHLTQRALAENMLRHTKSQTVKLRCAG